MVYIQPWDPLKIYIITSHPLLAHHARLPIYHVCHPTSATTVLLCTATSGLKHCWTVACRLLRFERLRLFRRRNGPPTTDYDPSASHCVRFPTPSEDCSVRRPSSNDGCPTHLYPWPHYPTTPSTTIVLCQFPSRFLAIGCRRLHGRLTRSLRLYAELQLRKLGLASQPTPLRYQSLYGSSTVPKT